MNKILIKNSNEINFVSDWTQKTFDRAFKELLNWRMNEITQEMTDLFSFW